jgi:hypothetical protein
VLDVINSWIMSGATDVSAGLCAQSDRPYVAALLCYMKYHNGAGTHLSLEKDAPVSRAVDRARYFLCRSILGGLHHQYGRIYDRHKDLW